LRFGFDADFFAGVSYGSVFLPKPYRGAEVVATLREMTSTA
jgi:hypothetical protein